MRILHTSDWHLNERQGHVDRQPDIVKRLVEIAGFLTLHKVDVMLVSGDMFSNTARLDQAKTAFEAVSNIFRPFLVNGGTMIVIGGNHDSEDLFNMCRLAMDLAAPQEKSPDVPKVPGRLYMYDRSAYLTLENKPSGLVQFVLLPYPFPSRYLKPDMMNFKTVEERNRLVHQALKSQLETIKTKYVKPQYPTVLMSHLHVRGNHVHNLYHISESQDVIFDPSDLPMEWAYSAFGHIHLPQTIRGSSRAQYAGSIDRFDFSEEKDIKSVVLLDIDQHGTNGEPTRLNLNATPLRRIVVRSQAETEALVAHYTEPQQDIVEVKIIYKPGEDNPDAMRDAIERVFPRWTERKIEPEGGDLDTVDMVGVSDHPDDVHATVRTYLETQLENHPDRDALLALADEMMANL